MRVSEDQVIAGLTKRGVPAHVAQGVVMNFKDESGLRTDIQEHSPIAGRGGYGLAQWTGPRRVSLERYAASRGVPVDDLEMQLDFFIQENEGAEAGAWSKVLNTSSPNDAAVAFVTHWERPAAEHRKSRVAKYKGAIVRAPLAAPEGTSAPTERSSSHEALMGTGVIPQYVDKVELTEKTPGPPVWEVQKAAWNTEQTIPWLFSGGTYTQPDPEWNLPRDRLASDLKERGIDPEVFEKFGFSHSEAHYQENLQRASDNQDRLNLLREAGGTGVALQIANQMLDPVALAADVAASAAGGAVFALGNRARRVGRVLHMAAGGLAGGAAAEAVNYAVNPNRDQVDILYGAVLGAGIGGAIGGLMKNPQALAEAGQLATASQRMAALQEGVSMPGSVGAARAPEFQQFLKDDAFEYLDADKDFAKTFGSSLRPDLYARLQASPSVVTKSLSGLVQDGTGKANGALNPIAASEEQTLLFSRWATARARVERVQVREFTKADPKHDERLFNEQVDDYIRDRRPDRASHYHPAVVKMGDHDAKLYARILELEKNPFLEEGAVGRAVAGSENVKADAHYAPRHWHSGRVIAATNEYVEGTIEELFTRAIMSAQAGIDPALAGRLGKAMSTAIVKRSHGVPELSIRTLSGDNMDAIKKVLMDEGDLAAEDAQWLVDSFKKRSSDSGRDSHLKRRVLLDEDARLDAPKRKDGTVDEQGLSIKELFDRDAAANFQRHARSVSGRVALARYRFADPHSGEVLINGITSDGEWGKLIERVKDSHRDLIGQGKMTAAESQRELKRLDFTYASIMGRQYWDAEATDAGWLARAIRKFNFARIMNQVGFAQIAEVGLPIASLGIKATFSHAPALRRLVSQDGETILRSGLADDIELWTGLGTERLRAVEDYRFDDVTGIHDQAQGNWRDRVEGALNKAGRVTSEISGLNQANIMLYRWAGASIIQKFANMAQKGGKGMSKARLADLGLDEAMTARVMKMFQEPGNFQYRSSLITGKKVVRMFPEKWTDKEAGVAFQNAVYRMSGQLIQRNDIGNLAMFTSHPTAKLLFQFRTFIMGAWGKQTLKAANFRDWTAAKTMALTSALAGASYIMQMKIQAIGRDDDEFLEKRLSPGAIAAAAFSRAGPASIVPTLIDTSRYALGKDALFSYTRTTGQTTDALFGNPTTGGIDDAIGAVRSLSGLLEDREWSQEEARSVARILPFGNALTVLAPLNAMIRDQPLFAPRDRD